MDNDEVPWSRPKKGLTHPAKDPIQRWKVDRYVVGEPRPIVGRVSGETTVGRRASVVGCPSVLLAQDSYSRQNARTLVERRRVSSTPDLYDRGGHQSLSRCEGGISMTARCQRLSRRPPGRRVRIFYARTTTAQAFSSRFGPDGLPSSTPPLPPRRNRPVPCVGSASSVATESSRHLARLARLQPRGGRGPPW